MAGDPILDRICQWARGDTRVRLVVLGGSRGRDDPAADSLSDYNVSLFVTGVGSFANDNGWYEQFGPVLVSRHDVIMVNGEEVPVRQVIYEGSLETVDFSVFHVRLAQSLYASHRIPDYVKVGYKVLLDKDTRAYEFKPVSGLGYVPQRPRPAQYAALVNDFWWQTTVAAKHLLREDLFQAKHSLECVVRFTLLNKMLGWGVQIGRDWRCNPGKLGSRVRELLPAERRDLLAQTFAGGEIADNWRALFRACDLFREVALEVAAELGYQYPGELDANVTEYLQAVQAGRICAKDGP